MDIGTLLLIAFLVIAIAWVVWGELPDGLKGRGSSWGDGGGFGDGGGGGC